MILPLACRFSDKESKLGLDGSLVQHGGEYECKGVPAMLERLYELPEGKEKQILGLSWMGIFVHMNAVSHGFLLG
jgi:hypothetical protein